MRSIVTKTGFAKLLRISQSRVSQFVRSGLPILPDGRINIVEGLKWVVANIEPALHGGAAEVARELLARRHGIAENVGGERCHFTATAAAVLLERDVRAINRALEGTPADSVEASGTPQWRLATIVKALARGSSTAGGNMEAAIEAIEHASVEYETALDRLQAAPDVETARALVRDQGLGRTVGQLARALERGAEAVGAADNELLTLAREVIVGRAIANICSACRWELEDMIVR